MKRIERGVGETKEKEEKEAKEAKESKEEEPKEREDTAMRAELQQVLNYVECGLCDRDSICVNPSWAKCNLITNYN